MITRLMRLLANALDPAEREAVLGDLAESNQPKTEALRDLFGLAARRQIALWKHWQPWLLLIVIVIPLGASLGLRSQLAANLSAVTTWLYLHNFQPADLSDGLFLKTFADTSARLLMTWLSLACWAWGAGFGVGTLARRTRMLTIPVFAAFVVVGSTMLGHGIHSSAAFAQPFYRLVVPMLSIISFTLIPALHGAAQAGRLSLPSIRSQQLLLAFVLAPLVWPIALATAFRADFFPLWLLWGGNLLGVISYWPIAYWIARKWRSLRPVKMISASLLVGIVIAGRANAQPRPEFEVASIKIAASDRPIFIGVRSLGTFTAQNVTLRALIAEAYNVKAFQIDGGPDWAQTEHFDIAAKPRVTLDSKPALDDPAWAEMNAMLRALLEDRFHLRLHRTAKDLPVYTLTVAKTGSKLPPTTCAAIDPDNLRETGPANIPANACGNSHYGRNGANRTLDWIGTTPADFAKWALPNITGHNVIDKTGLNERADIHLEWLPNDAASDASGPSLYAALQEQLGLKLESTKAPTEVLVIERAERPDEN